MTRKLTARPTCGVCGRLVDDITEEEDPAFDRVRFTVYCHGERESVELTINDFRHMRGGIQFGEAFAGPKRLGP